MYYDKLSKALAKALKVDRIKDLENFAEQGSIIAQLMLGEIYFFAITADGHYQEDLFEIAAMEVAIKKSLGKKTSLDNFYYRVTFGYCEGSPDIDKALKWYQKAAFQGNDLAAQRIEQIRKGEIPPPQDGKRIMQFFGIDYSPWGKRDLTCKTKLLPKEG